MEIAESKRQGVVIMRLTGRLDASTAGVLEEKLRTVIDAGERHLVLDCEPLAYISSAGLRVLLMAAKRLRGIHGAIALAALQEHIKEVFDIAGFSSIFHVCDRLEEAVAALQA